MRQVRLAAVLAAMMIASVSAFGDTETGQGSAQFDRPDVKVGTVAKKATADPSPAPDTATPVITERGEPGQPGPRGLTGKRGPHGSRAPQGLRGLRGLPGRPGASHQHPKSAYMVAKDMNPASCSRLDAKLAQNSRADRGYTDGRMNQHLEESKHRNGWNWWWLLWLLLILLALWTLSRISSRLGSFWTWLVRLVHRPYIGTIINTASGWYGKHKLEPSRVEVDILRDFSRVDLEKHGKNLTAGGDYAAVVEAEESDIVRYRIRYRNRGLTPKPANRVFVKDTLQGSATYVPGSGKFFINNCDRTIACPTDATDDIVRQLHEGKVLRMSDIPGAPETLPQGSLYLTYEVEVGDGEDIGDIGEEFVTVPLPRVEPPTPLATQPPATRDEVPAGTFAARQEPPTTTEPVAEVKPVVHQPAEETETKQIEADADKKATDEAAAAATTTKPEPTKETKPAGTTTKKDLKSRVIAPS